MKFFDIVNFVGMCNYRDSTFDYVSIKVRWLFILHYLLLGIVIENEAKQFQE